MEGPGTATGEEDQRAEEDFETTNEARQESGMGKADAGEAFDARLRSGELADALVEEAEADGEAS